MTCNFETRLLFANWMRETDPITKAVAVRQLYDRGWVPSLLENGVPELKPIQG